MVLAASVSPCFILSEAWSRITSAFSFRCCLFCALRSFLVGATSAEHSHICTLSCSQDFSLAYEYSVAYLHVYSQYCRLESVGNERTHCTVIFVVLHWRPTILNSTCSCLLFIALLLCLVLHAHKRMYMYKLRTCVHIRNEVRMFTYSTVYWC